MEQATAKSQFQQGQTVTGVYCGKNFAGVLNDNCRPTPDGRNMIFGVTLAAPIEVYGQSRERVEIWTNGSDTLYLM